MQARTAERIEAWETRPFAGGVDGLRDLADAGFSGAIDASPWVFVLDGRVVGVVDGAIEDVGPGTAYVAPHDSLPLLFVMLERGGERRGQYYTGETPIEEVDATLREGGFTGYMELSENVLSGDYYLVYHRGERRACAFIGQAERLETGEEAYERAVDEVGIYTVTAVDVGTVDLPGSAAGGSASASTGSSTTGAGSVAGGASAASEPAAVSGADGPSSEDADAGGPAVDASAGAPVPASPPAAGDLRPAVRPATGPPPVTPAASDADAGSGADRGVAGAENETGAVEELEARVGALREEREDLAAENERLREELAALREEREDLAAEVRRLEERVRDLEADPGGERTLALDAEEALAGTSLFVRYEDKSGATLSGALTGDSDPAAVGENLTLEHHTTFDDDAAAVDDRPFEAFLEESLEYEVAAWLVNEFPYEIAETGHVDDMGALYGAIPEIDRIEFRGSVETGEDETAGFDVVCRDRLGTPLVAVDLHDSRDPAGEAEMEALLESADAVAETTGSIAGAVVVTASFFDPQAMETATAATDDGGLLGGSRASFVRLSRRVGYHLCLVEARDRRFHVAMPEL